MEAIISGGKPKIVNKNQEKKHVKNKEKKTENMIWYIFLI